MRRADAANRSRALRARANRLRAFRERERKRGRPRLTGALPCQTETFRRGWTFNLHWRPCSKPIMISIQNQNTSKLTSTRTATSNLIKFTQERNRFPEQSLAEQGLAGRSLQGYLAHSPIAGCAQIHSDVDGRLICSGCPAAERIMAWNSNENKSEWKG